MFCALLLGRCVLVDAAVKCVGTAASKYDLVWNRCFRGNLLGKLFDESENFFSG